MGDLDLFDTKDRKLTMIEIYMCSIVYTIFVKKASNPLRHMKNVTP